MKALTYQGVRDVEVSTIDDPKICEPTDVIVKVYLAGVCGSDLHVYNGREQGIACGTAMGHEFVGEIVELGNKVSQFSIGDVVLSPFTTNCGTCYFCQIGLTCRCQYGQLYGWREENGEGLHGGQAEYVRVPLAESTLVLLKPGVSMEEGLLIGDNLSTGYYCASQAEISAGGIYVVLGCGSVGLMAVAAAVHLNAEKVFAIDSISERLEKAQEFGAIAINYKTEDVKAKVYEATDGRGADSVLEVVGSPEASKMALDLVRPGGIISTVGVHTVPQFAFSPVDAYNKNITFKIGRSPSRFYVDKLIENLPTFAQNISSVITHRFPLSEGKKAYSVFDKKTEGCIKPVIDLTQDMH